MGFLDKLLGREKKAEDMPAEPRREGAQPEAEGMGREGMAQEPGTEGTQGEREQ